MPIDNFLVLTDLEIPCGGSNAKAMDQWVLVNAGAQSYYRVLYDTHNYKLLIKQLLEDHQVMYLVSNFFIEMMQHAC